MLLYEMARAVVWGVVAGVRAPLPACAGHHWHPEGRSWLCCRCPERIRQGRDAPEHQAACAQPKPHFDELMDWLSELTPPDPRPLAGLRAKLRRSTA